MSDKTILNEELESSLSNHLDVVKNKIRDSAINLASKSDSTSVSILHLADAIKMYAPGCVVDSANSNQPSVLKSISPMTWVSAFMAIVFGLIGVVAIKHGAESGINGKEFIEIAKIFAGAIVGSASATYVFKKSKA